MTQVKFNVRHKYPEDLAKKAVSANKKGGLAPKNVISAKEHTRIDVCGQQADGNDNDSDSDEEESDKEEEEESELETVDQWIDALLEAMPDDDAAFFDNCLEAKESGTKGDGIPEQSDSDADSDDELDCFEMRNENLLNPTRRMDGRPPQANLVEQKMDPRKGRNKRQAVLMFEKQEENDNSLEMEIFNYNRDKRSLIDENEDKS
jgi:hypothetical protein